MAQKKTIDIRDQSVEELQANLVDSRRKLFELRNEKKQTKQLEKPHTIRLTKKEIARMLTVLQVKQQTAAEKII